MSNKATQFKKGQSGNPKGAPKRTWTWSGVLSEAVEEAAKDGKTVKEHVARSLIRESLKGNVHAMRELMNRMDGMPQQDVTTDGKAITGPTVYIPKEDKEDNE